MLKLNHDDQYVLTIGTYRGETVSWHLKHRRLYLHTVLCCMADNADDVAIVTAALAVWEQGLDPETTEFWAAVDAIVGEKQTMEDEWKRYDNSVPIRH